MIKKNRVPYVLFGLLLWTSVAIVLAYTFVWLLASHDPEIISSKARIKKYIKEQNYLIDPLEIGVIYDGWVSIQPGDKLYLIEDQNKIEIGCIKSKKYSRKSTKMTVYITVYEDYINLINNKSEFVLVKEPLDPISTISMLVPDQKLDQIKTELKLYFEKHLIELKDDLPPIAMEIFDQSLGIIKKNAISFLNKDSTQTMIDIYSKKLKEEYLEREFKPIFKQKIWPIVELEALKIINPILKEMVDQFPTAEVGFLYVYQTLPGTDTDHVEKRIKQFFDEEALLIVSKYADEIKNAQIQIISNIKENKEIKEFTIAAIKKLFEDQEISDWIKQSVQELYARTKPEILNEFQLKWKPRLQEITVDLLEKFEPYALNMAYQILLNLEISDGITPISPELAKVIRRQILQKDRFYIYTKPVEMRNEDLLHKFFNGKRD